MKILLTILNPPEGMNPSQLFDNEDHFNTWKNSLEGKIPSNLSIEKVAGKVKSNDEDWAIYEEKENDFKNY